MSYSELICYQIKSLKIINNLGGIGDMDTLNTEHVDATFTKDCMATVRLVETIEAEEESLFSLQLTLEGIFSVQGVKSDEQKDDAFRKFYEELFPIAAEIIQDITIRCDIPDGIRIQPNCLKIQHVSGTEEKNGKIIDFPTEE